MLAKAVATLDRLTDGRAELAIDAGVFWDAIAGMGGPRRAPAEAVAATAEAFEILQRAFAGTRRVVLNISGQGSKGEIIVRTALRLTSPRVLWLAPGGSQQTREVSVDPPRGRPEDRTRC